MAKNTIKNSSRDDEEDVAPLEEKTSKPKKTKPSGDGRWARFMAFMREPRVQKIVGIFLVLFSIFVFLSCASYLFSGEHDQRLEAYRQHTPISAL